MIDKFVLSWVGVCVATTLVGCSRGNNSPQFSAADGTPIVSPTTMPVGDLPPRSMASFKNAIVTAFTTQDMDMLQRLAYPDQVTEEHRQRLKDSAGQGMGRPVTGITEESVDSLGKGVTLSGTVDGVRYKANLKHLGYIRVAFHTESRKVGIQPSGINMPYGMKDGAYYIINSVRVK